MTEQEKQAFEEWLGEKHRLTAKWDKDRNCYEVFSAQLAWKAWQASAERYQAEIKALRGFIRSLRNTALLNNIDQSQVIDAMKAWDLIDATGQPTALLTGESE